jgi:hypothetical protein
MRPLYAIGYIEKKASSASINHTPRTYNIAHLAPSTRFSINALITAKI